MGKVIKQKEITIADKIIARFDEHQETVDAILKSEAFTEDVEVEITAANDNLQEDLNKLFEENNAFENIYPKLEHLRDENELTDENVEQLLGLIDDYDITSYLEDKGYSFVKIKSADQQAKLAEFLKTEIYPYYNDQIGAETNLF